jgi:hypothetical protein
LLELGLWVAYVLIGAGADILLYENVEYGISPAGHP